ncbi:MAG: hypothetical protein IKJ01_09450 [Lachnospiraceae bacterium]|nr:hypothetical protein [Lachnospiraceae bacterium]
MTEKSKLKNLFLNRMEVEQKREELRLQVNKIEEKIQKLTNDLQKAKLHYDSLENSSIKKLLLGITGKREEQLQKAQNEIRIIQGQITSIEFECNSMKNEVETLTIQLNETADCVDEYIYTFGDTEEEEVIKQAILAINKIPNLRYEIEQQIPKIKRLLEKSEQIYVYGDLQTDAFGRSYNRKDTTLRELARTVQKETDILLQLLAEYNSVTSENIRIGLHEDWMDDSTYWENCQLAQDCYERIHTVNWWFEVFTYVWDGLQEQQNQEEENLRAVIRNF